MSFSVWQNHICLIKQLVAQCFCCCFVAAKYNFVTQYLQKLVFLSDCTTTSTLQLEAIIRIVLEVLDFQIQIALCLIFVSFIQHLFNLYFSIVQVQKNKAVIFLNKIHPFKNRIVRSQHGYIEYCQWYELFVQHFKCFSTSLVIFLNVRYQLCVQNCIVTQLSVRVFFGTQKSLSHSRMTFCGSYVDM